MNTDLISIENESSGNTKSERMTASDVTNPVSAKKFHCSNCDKVFLRKFSLERHNLVHSGDKPFRCEFCPKHFRQRFDLIRHITGHTGTKDYECKFCFERFNTKKNLQYHEALHSRERLFKCNICDKSFKVKRLLNFHEKLHKTEKPFACEVCDLRFRTKSYLTSHRIVHSNKRPFVCELCPTMYKRMYELKQHKRNRHGIVDRKIKREVIAFDHVLPSGGVRTEILGYSEEAKQENAESCQKDVEAGVWGSQSFIEAYWAKRLSLSLITTVIELNKLSLASWTSRTTNNEPLE